QKRLVHQRTGVYHERKETGTRLRPPLHSFNPVTINSTSERPDPFHTGQVVQRVVLKAVPKETPVHQLPPSRKRPVMSALPSPLKSPAWTSTQVAEVLHVAQVLVMKEEPVEIAVRQLPRSRLRPTRSALPSPLKSPT